MPRTDKNCRKLLAFCPEQEDCNWWGKFPDFAKNQSIEKPPPDHPLLNPEQEKERWKSDYQVRWHSISGSFTPMPRTDKNCRKLLAFCPEQEDCNWWGKFPDFAKNQSIEKHPPDHPLINPEQEKERWQSDYQVRRQSISVSFTPMPRTDKNCRKLLAFCPEQEDCNLWGLCEKSNHRKTITRASSFQPRTSKRKLAI
jgi:hypothetical protein